MREMRGGIVGVDAGFRGVCFLSRGRVLLRRGIDDVRIVSRGDVAERDGTDGVRGLSRGNGERRRRRERGRGVRAVSARDVHRRRSSGGGVRTVRGGNVRGTDTGRGTVRAGADGTPRRERRRRRAGEVPGGRVRAERGRRGVSTVPQRISIEKILPFSQRTRRPRRPRRRRRRRLTRRRLKRHLKKRRRRPQKRRRRPPPTRIPPRFFTTTDLRARRVPPGRARTPVGRGASVFRATRPRPFPAGVFDATRARRARSSISSRRRARCAPRERFAPANASVACAPFSPGSVGSEYVEPDSYRGAAAQRLCDAGSVPRRVVVRLAVVSLCAPCPAGTISSAAGAVNCTACALGSAPNPERTACASGNDALDWSSTDGAPSDDVSGNVTDAGALAALALEAARRGTFAGESSAAAFFALLGACAVACGGSAAWPTAATAITSTRALERRVLLEDAEADFAGGNPCGARLCTRSRASTRRRRRSATTEPRSRRSTRSRTEPALGRSSPKDRDETRTRSTPRGETPGRSWRRRGDVRRDVRPCTISTDSSPPREAWRRRRRRGKPPSDACPRGTARRPWRRRRRRRTDAEKANVTSTIVSTKTPRATTARATTARVTMARATRTRSRRRVAGLLVVGFVAMVAMVAIVAIVAMVAIVVGFVAIVVGFVAIVAIVARGKTRRRKRRRLRRRRFESPCGPRPCRIATPDTRERRGTRTRRRRTGRTRRTRRRGRRFPRRPR